MKEKEKVLKPKKTIGQCEYICLPEFGVKEIAARIDTGANTSSLHAENIEYFTKSGIEYVRFDVIAKNKQGVLIKTSVKAELHTKRQVKTHFGIGKHRPYVITKIKFGDQVFDAVLNLTNRTNMKYKLLIGREVLKKRFIVDVSKSYTLNKKIIK